MAGPSRRAALFRGVLLPLLSLGACTAEGDYARAPARGDFPALRYDYLPPLRLTVGRVRLDEGFAPSAGAEEIGQRAPVGLAGTLFMMARDRLKAAGSDGYATFSIQAASLTRRGDLLNGALAARLEVRDADNTRNGFVEARVTGTRSALPDQRAALYELIRSMMDDMNVELEYQIRRELRGWLVGGETPPPGAPDTRPAPSKRRSRPPSEPSPPPSEPLPAPDAPAESATPMPPVQSPPVQSPLVEQPPTEPPPTEAPPPVAAPPGAKPAPPMPVPAPEAPSRPVPEPTIPLER